MRLLLSVLCFLLVTSAMCRLPPRKRRRLRSHKWTTDVDAIVSLNAPDALMNTGAEPS